MKNKLLEISDKEFKTLPTRVQIDMVKAMADNLETDFELAGLRFEGMVLDLRDKVRKEILEN